MASAVDTAGSQDRSMRLRPFAWMRRLAHRRDPAKTKAPSKQSNKVDLVGSRWSKQAANRPQHPPEKRSTQMQHGRRVARPIESAISHLEVANGRNTTEESRSMTATVTTSAETILSEGDHQSKAGTSVTLAGGFSSASGGGNSIFSSANHSTRSFTTTLTTIQSQAPSTVPANHPAAAQPSFLSSTYFSHQYPTAPVSALPAHLNPHQAHLPTTYRSATANNLLTDNASIITLASSSHRHQRRNSLDTDASIRAIRPSSTWGASRESLPLSVLSQNVDPSGATSPPFLHTQSRSLGRDDRGSIPSGPGVGAPALSNERNSIYAGKVGNGAVDEASMVEGSVRSGFMGHASNGSSTGSIGGYSNTWTGLRENVVHDEF